MTVKRMSWGPLLTYVMLAILPAEINAAPGDGVQQPVGETASDAKRIQSEKFKDWFYRCVELSGKTDKSKRRCEVVQIAQTKHEGQTINLLTISFSKLAAEKKKQKEQTVITVLAPQNVYLPEGMKLGVDEGKKMILQFRNCNNAGCWTQHRLTPTLLRSFQKGRVGFAHLKLINGQNINIKFSLNGLTSALEALKKAANPKTNP